MNDLQRLYVCQNYFEPDFSDEIEKEWERWKEQDNNPLTDMGLLKGLTLDGLLYLTSFHNLDISWINLL